MTWTALHVERPEGYPARRNEPEREILRDWLDWHRPRCPCRFFQRKTMSIGPSERHSEPFDEAIAYEKNQDFEGTATISGPYLSDWCDTRDV